MMGKEQEFVNVKLPKHVYHKIKGQVEEHDGLFEDESDFVSHCVIHYIRNYK
jgi:Arc/MetJ-type ribon-helix-helix transcriptional regulator